MLAPPLRIFQPPQFKKPGLGGLPVFIYTLEFKPYSAVGGPNKLQGTPHKHCLKTRYDNECRHLRIISGLPVECFAAWIDHQSITKHCRTKLASNQLPGRGFLNMNRAERGWGVSYICNSFESLPQFETVFVTSDVCDATITREEATGVDDELHWLVHTMPKKRPINRTALVVFLQ